MISEIDGLQKSYHELDDEILPYMTVRGYAYEREIAESLKDRLIEAIKEAMPSGTIIWRTRPEVSQEKDPDKSWRWCAYMRLTTFPELPESFWRRFSIAEGHPGPRIFP